MTQKRTLRVALGQFFVQPESAANLEKIRCLIDRAEAASADLLILPEGMLAARPGDLSWGRTRREPLDGPFVTGLREATRGRHVAVVGTVQARIPGEERFANDLIVVQEGELRLVYQKLHPYDAFSVRESENAVPGDKVPELLRIGPFECGFMICYDLRFPELARALALKGATLLVAPAAWIRGPLKESHWDLCVRSRALENVCFVAAVSECGPRCIGSSKIADPFGVVVAQCGSTDEFLVAEIDADRVARARESLPVLENRRFAAPRLRGPGED